MAVDDTPLQHHKGCNIFCLTVGCTNAAKRLRLFLASPVAIALLCDYCSFAAPPADCLVLVVLSFVCSAVNQVTILGYKLIDQYRDQNKATCRNRYKKFCRIHARVIIVPQNKQSK